MDDLLSPYSSFLPPSPCSKLSTVHEQQLEFVSQDLPEPWLFDGSMMSNKADSELWPMGSPLAGSTVHSELPPSLPATPQDPVKRRGRKPGSCSTVSHVQAERQRRNKLNRRFCDLRAAVPTVSRMDKASLLSDATIYITELRSRLERLEEAKKALEQSSAAASRDGLAAEFLQVDETVDMQMVGRDAAVVRVTTAASHAPARLMGALRSLDLQVQHACVSRVHGVTRQSVLVDVPTSMQDEDSLRSAVLQTLQDSA
ncbi:hypothetical protein CFC21_107406 [Triticum aestivum]|uniref:Transcription factor n=2 Tax=Triticum aestivum TaxID=4565 RepID=A0A9R1MG85_WHEAT|nr:transcription factor MYC1-like [Triticum aestivum]KAF7106688.1 hypothetical protein CFC21_107406 [Triticum aestivum]